MMRRSARVHQCVLIMSTLVLSWLGMMAAHELGHVLGAWVSGGAVAQVTLHPLAFSHTDLSRNPAPLLTVWMGPIVGVVLPGALWALLHLLSVPGAYVGRFLAGFCLIANGAYLGFGTLDRIGDVDVMLRHGTPVWALWLFAAICMPAGLITWHRLGLFYGLGRNAEPIEPSVAYITLALAVLLVAITFAIGRPAT